MGNYEHLDKERFVKNQGFLKEAAQYFSDCNIRMFGSGDHYDLQHMMDYYDGLGEVHAGVARFKDAQRRLTDLRDAMAAYLKDWEQAQEDAKSQFGNIDGESEAYNGPVFADIYQSELEEGPDYDLSQAYSFAQSGKSFSVDYNDLGAFIWTSNYGKSVRIKWGDTQFSNKENYWEWITNGLGIGDGNYELMENALTSSLESMLKQLPGYEGVDVDYETLDWDAIGDEIGVPGMGNAMKLLLKIMKAVNNAELQGTPISEEVFEWIEELKKVADQLQYDCYESPWVAKMFDFFVEGVENGCNTLNAIGEYGGSFAGGLAEAGKKAMTGVKFMEFASQMVYHMCSNHTIQAEYLESLREALEASGFTSGVVIEKIEELEHLYSDKMSYFLDEVKEKFYDEGFDKASDFLIEKIPGLKDVTFVADLYSAAAKVAWGEETGAMNTLMGLYQYDEALTRTFENYTSLMEQGVATAEDVKRANDLYDILVITKKQEYENILKIVKDEKSEWFIMATEKLEELNNLPTKFDMTAKEAFRMTDLEDVLNTTN